MPKEKRTSALIFILCVMGVLTLTLTPLALLLAWFAMMLLALGAVILLIAVLCGWRFPQLKIEEAPREVEMNRQEETRNQES